MFNIYFNMVIKQYKVKKIPLPISGNFRKDWRKYPNWQV